MDLPSTSATAAVNGSSKTPVQPLSSSSSSKGRPRSAGKSSGGGANGENALRDNIRSFMLAEDGDDPYLQMKSNENSASAGSQSAPIPSVSSSSASSLATIVAKQTTDSSSPVVSSSQLKRPSQDAQQPFPPQPKKSRKSSNASAILLSSSQPSRAPRKRKTQTATTNWNANGGEGSEMGSVESFAATQHQQPPKVSPEQPASSLLSKASQLPNQNAPAPVSQQQLIVPIQRPTEVYGSTSNHRQSTQTQGQQPPQHPPSTSHEAQLLIYIHDHLKKRGYHTVAALLAHETPSLQNTTPDFVNSNQGFLSEWWSVFWDVWSARRASRSNITSSSTSPTPLGGPMSVNAINTPYTLPSAPGSTKSVSLPSPSPQPPLFPGQPGSNSTIQEPANDNLGNNTRDGPKPGLFGTTQSNSSATLSQNQQFPPQLTYSKHLLILALQQCGLAGRDLGSLNSTEKEMIMKKVTTLYQDQHIQQQSEQVQSQPQSISGATAIGVDSSAGEVDPRSIDSSGSVISVTSNAPAQMSRRASMPEPVPEVLSDSSPVNQGPPPRIGSFSGDAMTQAHQLAQLQRQHHQQQQHLLKNMSTLGPNMLGNSNPNSQSQQSQQSDLLSERTLVPSDPKNAATPSLMSPTRAASQLDPAGMRQPAPLRVATPLPNGPPFFPMHPQQGQQHPFRIPTLPEMQLLLLGKIPQGLSVPEAEYWRSQWNHRNMTQARITQQQQGRALLMQQAQLQLQAKQIQAINQNQQPMSSDQALYTSPQQTSPYLQDPPQYPIAADGTPSYSKSMDPRFSIESPRNFETSNFGASAHADSNRESLVPTGREQAWQSQFMGDGQREYAEKIGSAGAIANSSSYLKDNPPMQLAQETLQSLDDETEEPFGQELQSQQQSHDASNNQAKSQSKGLQRSSSSNSIKSNGGGGRNRPTNRTNSSSSLLESSYTSLEDFLAMDDF